MFVKKNVVLSGQRTGIVVRIGSWNATLLVFFLFLNRKSVKSSSKSFASLPYIKGVTEPLTRVLKKHDITVVNKPLITLQQQLPAPKLGCVLVYRYTKEGNINELRHNSMYGYENKRNSLVYRYTRTAPKIATIVGIANKCYL